MDIKFVEGLKNSIGVPTLEVGVSLLLVICWSISFLAALMALLDI